MLNLEEGGVPWAVPIEFETTPKRMNPARALEYIALVFKDYRPVKSRKDRFDVGMAVMFLRGKRRVSHRMVWRSAGMGVTLEVRQRNLAQEDASATLEGIANGSVPAVVLPLVPLMIGGDQPAVVTVWAERLRAVAEDQQGTLAGWTRVFADAARCLDLWRAATEGWGVIRSKVVDEWRAEWGAQAAVETLVRAVLRLLRARFTAVPDDLASALSQITNVPRLEELSELAGTVASLDDFRTRTGL